MLFWVGVVIVAQATEDWWQSPTGRTVGYILSGFVALGVLAGGVKGAQYLAKTAVGAHLWGLHRWKERRLREERLDLMLSDEGWPALVATVEKLTETVARIESKIGRE